MKRLLQILLMAALAACLTPAHAHGGAKAKYGGTLASANDLAFELVATAEGATLYVEDHGKPLATTGMSGKLTVLTGAEKKEAELKPTEANKLAATGIKLASGAKVVATLTDANKKATTVRFVIK